MSPKPSELEESCAEIQKMTAPIGAAKGSFVTLTAMSDINTVTVHVK
jgi:hypothetical protein